MILLLRRLAPIVGAALLFSLRAQAQVPQPIGHDTFYLSAEGDDSFSGLSATFPWRTTGRLNQQNLCPGDFVYFEGGRTFDGTIVVGPGEGGTPDEPITFTTYGSGTATVSAASHRWKSQPNSITAKRIGTTITTISVASSVASPESSRRNTLTAPPRAA